MTDKCLYKESMGGKSCMPNGGVNDISEVKDGEVVKMENGEKYQCIKCKWPRCL